MDYSLLIEKKRKQQKLVNDIFKNINTSVNCTIPLNEDSTKIAHIMGSKTQPEMVSLQSHIILSDKDKLILAALYGDKEIEKGMFRAEYTKAFDRMNISVKMSNIEPTSISSLANVYKNAKLVEVNGNLKRFDIDWNAKIPQDLIERMRRSSLGDDVADKWSVKTNMDLIREGKAPFGPDGKRVNLHHVGQKSDSPLAELTDTEHKGNDSILHNKTKDSEIERTVFRDERKAYWQSRYNELNLE